MNESAKERRPLSPHLQVYKIQITSLLSILHRGTGIVLYGGAILWVGWLLVLSSGQQSYESMQSFVFHPLGLVVLLGLTFSFFYHFCNGLRHLLWDAGYGFEMTTVRRSGWFVVISTFVLTISSWVLAMTWGMIWS